MEEAITCVLERYGYRIEDVFYKSFKDGGLTLSQIYVLFEETEKRRLEEFKLLGKLLGAEFKDDGSKNTQKSESENKGVPLFGDPKQYENMTQEQKEELTKNMMNKHKQWAGGWSK
ncbi:MAG: hypothetical protein ACOC80_10990 [Petrotogales bacterium]